MLTDEPAATQTQRKEALWTVLAILLGAMVTFLVPGLNPKQGAVAGIFTCAVILWIAESLPLAMTAMLSTVALVVTGSLPSKEAFGAYGDQIILLFIGSFILAKSMEDCGLDRRLALWVMSKPWATKSASGVLLSLGAVACLISLFVSNTATTAMLLPIALRVLKTMGTVGEKNVHGQSFMLMLAWGSSIAVGTIIGTPPNVIGVGLIREATGTSINFVQWTAFAMPITILMLIIAWLLLKPKKGDDQGSLVSVREYAQGELKEMGKLSSGEKVTLIGFAVAIVLWFTPGITEYVMGSGTPIPKLLNERIPEAVAALIGASLLFILPAKGIPGGKVMTWKSATQIEWGTVLLFAGGLALGKAAFDSGLAKLIGESAARATGAHDVWAITALATLLAIVVSELASNTASATVVVPVAIALAQGAGVSAVPAALGAVIGSNLGFMLPISTPPNAVVYSTGLVPSGVMIRKGIIFDIIGFIVTMACLRIFLPMLGLA